MDSQPTPGFTPPPPRPITESDSGIVRTPRRNRLWWIIGGIVAAVAMLAATTIAMYHLALAPVNSANTTPQTIEIVSGTTPNQIAELLKSESLIRSELAFAVYTRLHGIQNNLQAGTYELSQSQSTRDIAAALTKGPVVKEFEVTFLPGGTLADHKKVLMGVGFSETEIDAAFTARYDHPLFEGRPASADLEGYIYGETHRFIVGTSVEDVLTRYFDDYYAAVRQHDLVGHYQAQGLSLYQGITLASIIQRESGGDDKAQIAQVFLTRLARGMELGSDVTYQYIADKLGVPRDVNLDNPYNTRRYPGLPPGPIASPGVDALIAAGSPADGDYLYFLSGDDNVTYFARTLAEHEENIRQHCQQKCQII